MKKKLLEKFKEIDSYSEPVVLKIKGNEKTPSMYGALLTLVINITLAAYAIYRM
jgi:hypothetical protein